MTRLLTILLLLPLICSAQYRADDNRHNPNVGDGNTYGYRGHWPMESSLVPSGADTVKLIADIPQFAALTLSVYAVFTGVLIINWDDGSEPESMSSSDEIPNAHEYSEADEYTIIITGDLATLTTLYCCCNSLISVDLDHCPALSAFACPLNNMTEAEITNTIHSLPDRTGLASGSQIIWSQNETYPQTSTPEQAAYLESINWPMPK